MARPTALLLLAAALCTGCYHDKHNLTAKFPDEYVLPPAEDRFDKPPTSDYRKPPPKKKFEPGGGMNGPGGFTNPGSGGRGFNNGSGF
jgi:hypothetical protein